MIQTSRKQIGWDNYVIFVLFSSMNEHEISVFLLATKWNDFFTYYIHPLLLSCTQSFWLTTSAALSLSLSFHYFRSSNYNFIVSFDLTNQAYHHLQAEETSVTLSPDWFTVPPTIPSQIPAMSASMAKPYSSAPPPSPKSDPIVF